MSVDNSELLMLLGGTKKAKQTIGIAGQQGFGVGVYGGDKADLDAMGLTPMDGCDDPASDNYGNYLHTNGSIMCFIPAFCVRYGNRASPAYSKFGSDTIEVKDAYEFESFVPGTSFTSASMGDGWILPRAFVDGGVVKCGFFIDKYLCSNVNGVAASVPNADWLMCYSGTNKTFYTNYLGGDCVGKAMDAITLSRARGEQYSCCTAFQWAALTFLATAHAQNSTSTEYCAWWSSGSTNFPKGATNSNCTDVNDSSISFAAHSYGSTFAKTGSCSNLAKTTHNGQKNGVADVAGLCNQIAMGAGPVPDYGEYGLFKVTINVHDITKGNRDSYAHYDLLTDNACNDDGSSYWGSGCIYTDTSGVNWSAAGVIAKAKVTSAKTRYGSDEFYSYESYNNYDRCIFVGLGNKWGSHAGVWCRSFYGIGGSFNWHYSLIYLGFRASGYAK